MLRTITTRTGKLTASLALSALLLGTASAGEPAGENWHRDWPTAWRDSQAQSRPILLYITMDNCYCCDQMSQQTYADAGVQSELQNQFVVASISVEEHRRLVEHLKIRSFPTTIIMGADRQILDCMSGYVGPQKMRTRLEAATAKLAQR